MPIFDLFSKRQKRLRDGINDVYTYDSLTQQFKIQVIHIIRDAIGIDFGLGNYGEKPSAKAYELIHNTIAREYGVFSLGKTNDTDEEALFNFFLNTNNIEEAIDIIELAFKCIFKVITRDFSYNQRTQVKLSPDEAIEELNERFKEHSIGYQFDGGEIIRVDSTFSHSEIVKPTIALLWNKKFEGANEEYLNAHEHYRHGRNKECLTECLKAFESTLKIICNEKKWSYNKTDTSKKLIQICFQNDLIPSFSQNQFTSLQNLLESGIPTLRNKLGGHGQGAVPQKVDDGITRYGLNLTGTNIIFLVEQSGIK